MFELIYREFAHKILVTGKSINFLKDICEEKLLIKGKKELKEYLESNGQYFNAYISAQIHNLFFSLFRISAEDIFADVPDTKLHMLIDAVYLSTSKKVLDIVKGPHKLLEHLKAMRNYLLLGQGDFIGMLMENMK